MPDWEELHARARERYEDGEARLPDDPDQRQRQLTRMGNAAGAAASDSADGRPRRRRVVRPLGRALPGELGARPARRAGAGRSARSSRGSSPATGTGPPTMRAGRSRSVRPNPTPRSAATPLRLRSRRSESGTRCGRTPTTPARTRPSRARSQTRSRSSRPKTWSATSKRSRRFSSRSRRATSILEDVPVADTVLVLQALAGRRGMTCRAGVGAAAVKRPVCALRRRLTVLPLRGACRRSASIVDAMPIFRSTTPRLSRCSRDCPKRGDTRARTSSGRTARSGARAARRTVSSRATATGSGSSSRAGAGRGGFPSDLPDSLITGQTNCLTTPVSVAAPAARATASSSSLSITPLPLESPAASCGRVTGRERECVHLPAAAVVAAVARRGRSDVHLVAAEVVDRVPRVRGRARSREVGGRVDGAIELSVDVERRAGDACRRGGGQEAGRRRLRAQA